MKTHFIISLGTSIRTNYRFAKKESFPVAYPPGLTTQKTVFDQAAFPTPDMLCPTYEHVATIWQAIQG